MASILKLQVKLKKIDLLIDLAVQKPRSPFLSLRLKPLWH